MEATSPTNSTTRSLVTALGGGSGIDMVALASDLATAQFATRADRLAYRSEALDRQISTASNLRSMLSNLTTSLGERVRLGDLSPQPRIANGAVAQTSLTGTLQPQGSYSLEVTALASAQTLVGPAYTAASDPVGSGTLTLRFGTVSGSSFTEDTARSAVDIDIPSGATLGDVAAAINGAKAGVRAYVAQTVDGAQLVLKGEEGAANGFVLQSTENGGEPGLSRLAWMPGSGDAGRLIASSGDAALMVDGLSLVSTSNTIANAIPGLSLQLTGTNVGAPTTISFSNPAEAINAAMQDLTAALNEVAGELRAATDPKTGDLARDSGAHALKRAFSSLSTTIIMPNAPEGTPNMLADLGVSTQRDGSFRLDQKRLAETLARSPEDAAAMFTNGLHGIYATIDGISRRANQVGDPGSLAGSISRYTGQLQKVGEDQLKLVEKQEDFRARMISRFAVSESRVTAAKSTLTFLENQIAVWNQDR